MKTACYKDLIEKYENPITHACDMVEGQVFIANDIEKGIGEFPIALSYQFPLLMPDLKKLD